MRTNSGILTTAEVARFFACPSQHSEAVGKERAASCVPSGNPGVTAGLSGRMWRAF